MDEGAARKNDPGELGGDIPSTPAARLHLVRDFAVQVFGKELTAAAWLGQLCPAVLDGACIVATACQTATGFREAMQELARLQRLRHPDDVMPSWLGARATPAPDGGNKRA